MKTILNTTRIADISLAYDAAHNEAYEREMYVPAPVLVGKRSLTKSCKEWLRELLSQKDASYTLTELVALTGKTEVNVRTMLSDLRNPKYAGKAGVFRTKSVRVAGVTKYSQE